jgi:hypothetical protein
VLRSGAAVTSPSSKVVGWSSTVTGVPHPGQKRAVSDSD